MIEAKKLAYADMLPLRRRSDDSATFPWQECCRNDYARRPRQADRHDRSPIATLRPASRGSVPAGDTIYLTAVDRDGNMVSLIQSNYSEFGSGLVADGTGFVLQNRGALFTLDANSPNALAGHKRPLHTIIPAFMEQGRRPHRVWHHGRIQPGAGARAVRLGHRRFRDEHPGGARIASIH